MNFREAILCSPDPTKSSQFNRNRELFLIMQLTLIISSAVGEILVQYVDRSASIEIELIILLMFPFFILYLIGKIRYSQNLPNVFILTTNLLIYVSYWASDFETSFLYFLLVPVALTTLFLDIKEIIIISIINAFVLIPLLMFHPDIEVSEIPIDVYALYIIIISILLATLYNKAGISKDFDKERQQHMQQLMETQNMETVGHLVGNISHDYNNILMIIYSNGEWLLQQYSNDKKLMSSLNIIKNASEKAQVLINRLLLVSEKRTTSRQIFEVNHLILETEELLQRILDKNVTLKVDLMGNEAFVEGDPNLLEQALINLIINAHESIDGEGIIHLIINQFQKSKDEKFITIIVRDTGKGIDHTINDKIFDPFFTTKQAGTGLGLSIIQDIIEKFGGYLEYSNILEGGTEFKLFIPSVESSPAIDINEDESKADKIIKLIRENKKINFLIVDDDEYVKTAIVRNLKIGNNNVYAFSNGFNALDHFKEFYQQIDILLVDVIMPEMSGLKFVEKALKIKPTAKIIFISGFTQNSIEHLINNQTIFYLSKPFSISDLNAMIMSIHI